MKSTEIKHQRMIKQLHKQHHQLHALQSTLCMSYIYKKYLRINRHADVLLKTFHLTSPLWRSAFALVGLLTLDFLMLDFWGCSNSVCKMFLL